MRTGRGAILFWFSLGHLAGTNSVDLSHYCPSLPVLRNNSTPVANTVEPSGVCVCAAALWWEETPGSGVVEVSQAKSCQPHLSPVGLESRQCSSDNYSFLGVHHSSS